MRHPGPPAGAERQAPCQNAVRQGRVAEEVEARGGGAEGELEEGL